LSFSSRLDCTQAVVVQYQRVLSKFRRHTGAGRVAESQHAGTRLYQQAIGVAVVAAFKFDDACPPGIAPRQTNSRHRGLRAGAHQTDLFHGRQASNDSFGDLDFRFGGGTERETIFGRLLNRLDHFRVSMTQDGWTPGTHVIDVALAFGVPHMGALRPLNEARRTAYGSEGA